ncbi:hypothetical protein SAY87_009282 [Trapa incisa]|uniref:SWIM-type domain-containing protein n=1 Tax=Trapa incisa TaxID=236973 RepID=A0AAN7Q2C1_9MYRT|nr:hypothetical protein SAY87_009282 [Trapa incisa]
MKKVIAICQSGGDFVTNMDGTLSYCGGDAYAIDIDEQTQLQDFKNELAEMFSCKADNITIKYFLPGNKRTLITVSKDKDLQRMVSFVGDSGSVDVFILPEEAAAHNMLSLPAIRSSEVVPAPAIVPVEEPCDMLIVTPDGPPPLNRIPPTLSVDKIHKAALQWENTITGVDQRFNSFSEFKEALHKYSIAHGFAYRYKKNDSHRVSVKCKSLGCPWRIYASRLSTTQLICIKKMNGNHTCEGGNVKAGYRATRGWVGNIIKEKLKESPNYKPKDIAEDIKNEYGIQLNYSQAWRAKEIAREQLLGSYKDSYKLLPFFCERIKETNPGSVAIFSTKEDLSFHSLFVSFHACISGFQQGCRPLLFLDSVPLLSKYQGVLLAAVSVDGDDAIFPVAFAIVDEETEENWRWFLQKLKSALQNPQQVTFVADFQYGLKKSLPEIFENCYHSYCLRQLAEKLNMDLKGQFSHEARRFMINDFYVAAQAPKLEGFQRALENIKNISSEAYDWVLQSEPEHWASAFFPGARYNLIQSNYGQDFYSWVGEVQELPITQIIDSLRGKMMETIYTRRMESNQWVSKLTPSKEDMLQKEASLVTSSTEVLISDGSNFEVRGDSIEIVDVETWDCSCKFWRLTGLPCSHAIAVLHGIDRSPYDYCSRFFTMESYKATYAESIYPVPNVEPLPLDDVGELALVIVTPPPMRRPPGRPKVKSADPLDSIKRQLQCSKCKGLGHNKKTCKAS